MDKEELIWKEINLDIDLYKFYLELLIKSATFFFVISGGIIAWYFSHKDYLTSKYSLLLPIIMNIGFIIVCAYGIRPAKGLKKKLEETCKKANFNGVYDMSPLIRTLYLFLGIYILVVLGLIVSFIFL